MKEKYRPISVPERLMTRKEREILAAAISETASLAC